MKKNLLFYAAVILIFGAGIYFMLSFGSRSGLDTSTSPAAIGSLSSHNSSENAHGNFAGVLLENLREPLSILLLQVLVILIAAKLVSNLLLKIGQPPVVGEMIAGIVLGPSLLGMLFPNVLSFLFPTPSMRALGLLSQVGIVLFMFIVGVEINTRQLQEKARAAVIISHASIIAPFFLGVAVSLLIYRSFAPANVPFTSFALFMGVAMSVTAFPVLARIIEERKLSESPLGSLAIACAAVDDVTAWCVLALIIAIVKSNGVRSSALTILLVLIFTAFMLLILRPRLNRLVGNDDETWKNGNGKVAVVLALAFTSALFTEVIGIHALFGAFLAGAVMPTTGAVRSFLKDKLSTFISVALLPLFFAFTGLRTQISLLDNWQSWLACAGIIAVAIAGKLGGGMLAARWAGMNWRDSVSTGVLMNTRGLVELVVLNIGYDLGILSGRIFAIMVLMALVTTCMTGPLLSLVEFIARKSHAQNRLAATA
jgi:Kef-type K+ transport system membrane component KefB